jgi:hypothetical protein
VERTGKGLGIAVFASFGLALGEGMSRISVVYKVILAIIGVSYARFFSGKG